MEQNNYIGAGVRGKGDRMSKMRIEGGYELSGEVMISGAKNSVVALLPASILCDEEVVIDNVPQITDVKDLVDILSYLHVKVNSAYDRLVIDTYDAVNLEIKPQMANKLRASYYFMGAMLGKYKRAVVAMPGGCTIGKRPIDLHLKGFEAMGAKVRFINDFVFIEANELVGCDIDLNIASVGATINIMLASVKAKGVTRIRNAAREPEIVNVAEFLISMGAMIKGAGTSVIEITGVNYLHSGMTSVIPDRIEAGTYLIIGALLGNNLRICNIIPRHLRAVIDKLKDAGVKMDVFDNQIIISKSDNYKAIDIKTAVYPGFPTDLQQPMIPFLTQCEGISLVFEDIYENRFSNVYDTVKMGASIVVKEHDMAVVTGKTHLVGERVTALDLRGGASLLICGLIASGETIIDDTKYILRGYDDIVGKLTRVGARVEIIDEG